MQPEAPAIGRGFDGSSGLATTPTLRVKIVKCNV
jgi:hypothetical protein